MDETKTPCEKWHDLATAIPGAVGIHSGEKFSYVSEEFATAVGVSPNDLVGSSWTQLFAQEEATQLREEGLETARTDGQWEGTVKIGGQHADEGLIELVISTITAESFLWTITDAAPTPETATDPPTPAQHPSIAIQHTGMAQTILDVIDDVVYVIDGDGDIVFCNTALATTTGYSREEIYALSPEELIPVEYHEYVPGVGEAIATIDDRRVDVDIRTKDGERIPHKFHGTSFRDPETGTWYRCGIARNVADQREEETELKRQRTLIQAILNTIPDVIFAYDDDGNHIVEDALLDEFAGYPKAELAAMELLDFLPAEDRPTARERFQHARDEGEVVTYETAIVTKDGQSIPHEFRAAPMEMDGEVLGLTAAARDITDRLQRERQLKRHRDELATLDRINELLLETIQELIQTSSREAVEQTVCELLTDSSRYQFAWVGERPIDSEAITPRTSAGGSQKYVDAITSTADEHTTGRGPAERAMHTGEIQVVTIDELPDDERRELAAERGVESIAAVPLHHRETVYGVLVIDATEPDACSPREQAGFDVLGRTVGFVIHATRNRDLLFADTVVELEFTWDDDELVAIAAALDCQLTLDGYVADDDQWIQYLTVTDATAHAVVDRLDDTPWVERARAIDTGSADGWIELVGESSLLQTITDIGGSIATLEVTPTGGRFVIESALDADIRELIQDIQAEQPTVDFVARRERDREVTTLGRPDEFLAEMTDRQREAITTAYRSGYYAWPRERTAEEVASTLGLAPATLHGHLRKAEATILEQVLDEAERSIDRGS